MIELHREIYQLKVSLKGITPMIWRRFLVPGAVTLSELHEVIQQVMGWTDSHLHGFMINGKRYGKPDPEFEMGEELLDESCFRVREILKKEGASIQYTYDFGDHWQHNLRLEKILPLDPNKQLPFCIAGRRSCPPEDVGGVWGYKDFLKAIHDENHPRHEELIEWAGDDFDPEDFDPEEVNQALRLSSL